MTTTTAQLANIIDDIFAILSDKEREVVRRRFALTGGEKDTLERIGKDFSVTRERIRQIENIALAKLRRTISTTRLKSINEAAKAILARHGNVLLEDALVSEVLLSIASASEVDGNIIRLSLAIDEGVVKQERTHRFKPFWHAVALSIKDIEAITDRAVGILKKEKDVVPEERLTGMLRAEFANKGKDVAAATLASCLALDHRIKQAETGWGLMTWRHINPKSIRDKALIIMRREQKPLHFVEIANSITEFGFDRKVVTVQAVHNELIRDEHFVLIGRGLYALREWGYASGTVAELIEELLMKKSPMSKEEIIRGVLQQRQVKKGTISLNLQKHPWFTRTGRALYTFDAKLKQETLDGLKQKRRRRG